MWWQPIIPGGGTDMIPTPCIPENQDFKCPQEALISWIFCRAYIWFCFIPLKLLVVWVPQSQISSCICHIDLMSLAKKLTDTFFTKRNYHPYYNIFYITGGAHQEISSTLEKLKWLPLLNSVTTRVSIRLQPASDYLKISQSFLCLSTGYRH